ncbi:MAG: right-handed parallel beta-helix repeat-containing protein, partial [Candidatus Hodarchaeales archaeon]
MKLLQKTGKKFLKSSYYSLIILIVILNILDIGYFHSLAVDNPTSPTIGEKIEIDKGILSPKDIIIANTYKPAYLNSPPPQIRPPEIKVLSIETLSAYSESSPIYIDNNTDFEDKANSSGWIGDGSLSSPYIITNLNITITSTSGYLIEIRNTDVYFQIEKCLLVKGSIGIRLTNVSNGKISENQLGNYSSMGIELRDSLEINISSNKINSENGVLGIYSFNTNNSIIYNNSVFEHEHEGIVFFQSYNNLFRKNWIYENGEEGVWVSTSVDNIIEDNWVFNNTWEGIEISTSKNCSFQNNTCIGNGEEAIKLWSSNDSLFINNTLDAVTLFNSFNPKIVRNNIFGIITLQSGGYANISNNSITSPGWAIHLVSFGQNYVSNNYIFNSGGGILCYNKCGNSTFIDLYVTNCTFGGAISLENSKNSTLINISAINCENGFSLSSSENCTVDQIYLKNLSGSGCTIYSSSYSNFTDVYIKNTSNIGFSLEETNSSYIDNITVINSSSNGFSISQSNNCILSNIDVINTDDSGFYASYSHF